MPTDRVIVRIKAGGATAKRAIPREEMAIHAGRALGEPLEFHRVMGDGAMVMRLPRRMTPSQIEARARMLDLDGATVEIEPDRIAFPQLVPTDPFYAGNQWNLKAADVGINAQPAWDVTTGSSSLVIAILDTGMLNHTDLAGRWLPGYDFIADTSRSNDGNARDANATDPGDWVADNECGNGNLAANSRWHGTLMAGVIAANANNGLKIAGINWNSKLLPVRVVGKCGGYTSDIADGMRWAAGLSIPGDPSVPANPNPAKVLNVSLAALSATCDTTFQNAIAAVTAAGATIVVSAGNFNGAAANQFSPGNCSGVITVGATDIWGGRPTYANTGDPIALSAPGGIGNGPGSVVTLSDGGTTNALNDNASVGTFGTSIAAAHVTGVASLVLSVRPNLTPAQVRDVLVTNVHAFPANAVASGSAANCTTAQCGAGILDAAAAITAVNDPLAGLPDLAAGGDHTLALKSDGTLYAWGRNGTGQLGDGTTTDRLAPVVVPIDGVTRIAAGGTTTGPLTAPLLPGLFQGAHSLAVRVDGSVWSWGKNTNGELGIGTIGDPVPTPTRVPGLRNVVAVSAGLAHSLALLRDGTVWAWGYNTGGLLGTGSTVNLASPAQVQGISNVTSIAAGYHYSCATKSDGTVWCWGDFFPLNGSTFGSQLRTVPTQVTGFPFVNNVSAGPDASHRVFHDPANLASPTAIGDSTAGQTGVAPTATNVFATPSSLAGGLSAAMRQFAVGRRHTIGVDSNDNVLAWGNDVEGQLGDGKAPGEANGAFRSAPVAVLRGASTFRVAAGGDRGIGVRRDGSVYSWGAGILGDGNDNSLRGQSEPVIVKGPGGTGQLNLGAVPAGGNAFFAPNPTDRYDVPPGQVVVSNPVLYRFSIGVTVGLSGGEISKDCQTGWTGVTTLAPGDLVCLRGTAPSGISSTPTTVNVVVSGVPVVSWNIYTWQPRLNADPFFIAPVAGAATASTAESSSVTITGLNAGLTASAVGGSVSIGCTGSYAPSGVVPASPTTLCVRTTTSGAAGASLGSPVTVGNTASVFNYTTAAPAFRASPSIVAAGFYALAIDRTGNLFGLGQNNFGQLRISTFQDQLFPALSDPTAPLASVDANQDRAVAIAADGSVWTWGLADRGQSGDRTLYERTVPPYAKRIALPRPAVQVSAGAYHALAILNDGSVWGWGYNGDKQLTTACPSLYCVQPVQVEAAGGGAGSVTAGVFNSYRVAAGTGVVSCAGRCYTTSAGNPVYYTAPTWDPFTPALGGGIAKIVVSASQSNSGGGAHYLALTQTGTVLAWGLNGQGQLGNGSTSFATIGVFPPVSVQGLSGVTKVAAGYNHSLALLADGTVRTWGSNQFGQLGDGTLTDRSTPGSVPGLSGVVAIAGNALASYALKADGRVFAWGYITAIGRGNGAIQAPETAGQVLGPGGSGEFNVGVQSDTVFAAQTEVPVNSLRVSNVLSGSWTNGSAISVTGGEYSIGCLPNGFTTAAGTINAGQGVCVRVTSAPSLGTLRTVTLTIAGVARAFNVTTVQGDTTPDPIRIAPAAGRPVNTLVESSPAFVTGLGGPAPVSVSGGEVSVGCNGVWSNTGVVDSFQSLCVRRMSAATPDTVATAIVTVGTASAAFHVITAPAAGFTVTPSLASGSASFGLRSDGRVYAWGYNQYGSVGDGSGSEQVTPVLLDTISGVTALSASLQHALALRSDGTVWAWGGNSNGELGDGTTATSGVPIRVALPGPPAVPFVAVSAGLGFSMALRQDGVAYAWGKNTSGQLGNGNLQDSPTPVAVAPIGGVTGIAAVSAGNGFSLLLTNPGGAVMCFGDCPGGSFPPYTTPFEVIAANAPNPIVAVSAGRFNSQFGLALRQDGAVFGWGENTFNQLATIGNFVFPPLQVAGLPAPNVDKAVAIATGSGHSVARTASGAVYTWGYNDCGQLGIGNQLTDGSAISRATPSRVAQVPGTTAIAADFSATYAANGNGSVFGWGCASGVGLGGSVPGGGRYTLPLGILGVEGDGYLSLQFVDTSPDPFAFPARFGVDPGATVTSSTVRITGLSAASPVSITGGTYAKNCTGGFTGGLGSIANNETICVQVAAPGAFETSASATLTIGSGNGARSATFTVRTRRATGSAPIAPQVSLGNAHSLVLASNGAVNGVGYNANGQLGNGTTLNTPTPLRIPGFTGARRIAAGAYHSLAVNANGTVSAWGYNAVGQLGLGAADSVRANPTLVPGLANVVAVAAGDYHSLALLQDGTVRAWGFNTYGQLGNGNTTNQSSPVLVSGLANVIAIAAGGQHSIALKADGTVVAWGANDSGQLGDGTTVSRSLPTAVSGLSTPGTANVVAIAAGTSHSLALRSSGTAWSWGANAQGQLGLGNTTPVSVPTQVAALGANVGLVAAGGNHSLAVKAGGALFSWGANANGQLGDGLSANRTTPFAVTTPAQATAIAAGARHSAAIDATGKVFLWGDNFFGQVGNRTGNFNPHSANLNVLRGDSRISTGAGGTGGGTGTASSAGSAVLNLGGLGGGYSFGSLAVGQPASAPVTYQNVASSTPIGSLGFSASGAGFSTSGSCPTSLNPTESCSFSLDFSAGSPGFYTGQLRIDSDLVGAPEIREVDATAVTAQSPALTLVASAVQFPPTPVGTVSASQSITVTNAGTATLSVTATSSSSPAFGLTNGCASVAPGASCAIGITYAPSVTGTVNATVTLQSNGGNAAIAVGGTGIAANYDIVPDAFSFPAAPNVALGGMVTSAPIAINGLGGPSPISVQGGEYSIGCTSTFTSAAGTIANGQTVCVRHQASATISTTVTTTLTVGGVSGTFSSTTTSTPPANPARLGNISTRMQVLTGDDVLIGGFIIGGNQPKTVVVRARGPSLAPAGITNFLANPKLDLYSGQTVIASNDDWGAATNASALQASGFAPANAQEAAILITLGPGAYTAIVSGVGGTTGVGIVEVFEVDLPQVPLLNISTRGQVLINNDVMIGGFIIMGDAPQTVIVRARGPSLAPFGITNFLANPVLQLFSGQSVIASNDNWQAASNAAEIQSRGFAPAHPNESAILITLNPGAYTAIVTGAGGTTGVGIIEVFAQ